MAFSPLARFRNFTLDNLKALLEVYPDEARTMEWSEAGDIIETEMSGYKKTSYQQACQFGIEDRSSKLFRIHNYLFTFDDENLKRYMIFWIKTYYAPNPYVKSVDGAFIIYCEILKQILESPTHEINYQEFFNRKIGGKSDDILLNALKSYAEPLKVKKVNTGDVLYIDSEQLENAKNELDYIESQMPIGNSNSKKEFFDRFSYENFCRFYGIETHLTQAEENVAGKINFSTGYKNSHPRNLIVFGAPGTGKSFTINKECKKLITNENKADCERVTFHPSYSYSNFVGTYKPVSYADVEGKDVIKYEYVPGPFMRILVKALENSKNEVSKVRPFLLIIEEINRANVAAVFGEVFQLLDRNSENVSEYSINPSEDVKKYLMDKLKVSEEEIRELKIPDNMFIWATMNSADQGVYPMDTAFKRRWEFKYIGINDEADKVKSYIIPIGNKENRKYVHWNDIRTKINDILLSEQCKVNEDKLLGPFFMSKSMLENAIADEDSEEYFIKAFESKVIMYLFEDVMKMRPQNIFRGHTGKWTYSEICSDFEINREKVFGINDLEFVDK